MPLWSRLLPIDILYMVFERIADINTLCTLLVVSRDINYIIAPMLYKNLSVGIYEAPERFDSLARGCLQQLRANDHRLASYVRSAVICLPNSGEYDESMSFAHLKALLPLLTKVKRLDVSFDIYGPTIDATILCSSLHTFKLTHLILGVMENLEALAVFLESQPLLQHFRMEGIPLGAALEECIIPLPSAALPNLHSLEGPPSLVDMMRGRSVAHVHFDDLGTFPEILQSLTGEESAKIRTLSGTSEYFESMVQEVTYFPNVEYLNLFVEDNPLDSEAIDSAFGRLNLSKIRYIRLSAERVIEGGERRAAHTIFEAIPSLLMLDIQSKTVANGLDIWQRFRRDAKVREKVVIWEPRWGLWWQSVEKDLKKLDSSK